MATTLDFSEVNNWLNSQPENTADTPYEIIITNAPASGYSSALDPDERFVSIVGMVMSSGVTSIGNQSFYRCSGLTSITIPNSVTSIGDRAFELCSNLTSITIPNSVTSIGWQAFYDCSGLTSINIPEGVTSIGDYAFYDCSGLTSVFMYPSFSENLMKSNSFSNTPGTLELHVPLSKKSGWQSATLSKYGFKADVKTEAILTPAKKWIRIA